MKERIRELYEQARLQAKSIDADLDPQGWMDLYHEKFAESIVRECCDIFVELRTRPADLAVKDVKKHFGVEE